MFTTTFNCSFKVEAMSDEIKSTSFTYKGRSMSYDILHEFAVEPTLDRLQDQWKIDSWSVCRNRSSCGSVYNLQVNYTSLFKSLQVSSSLFKSLQDFERIYRRRVDKGGKRI